VPTPPIKPPFTPRLDIGLDFILHNRHSAFVPILGGVFVREKNPCQLTHTEEVGAVSELMNKGTIAQRSA